MECREFRQAAGADPRHLAPEAVVHGDACPACAEFLRQTLALDERTPTALRVTVPGVARGGGASNVIARQLLDRRRWLALAGSIAGGVLVGSLLWVSTPQASLAEDVVRHVAHEPGAMVQTSAPADAATVERVLARGGVRLAPGVGLVSYAETCRLRGRKVPHLVVQTDAGPVTVMVLRNERVAAPVPFAEGGYTGALIPARPGSIAVIGSAPRELLDPVADRIAAAVEWTTK